MVDDVRLEDSHSFSVCHLLSVSFHLLNYTSHKNVHQLIDKIQVYLSNLDVKSEDASIFLLMLEHGAGPHHILPHNWPDTHPSISGEYRIMIEYVQYEKG